MSKLDLISLSQRERRAVLTALRSVLFDHPEYEGIKEVAKSLKFLNESTEDWKIGQKYYEEAVENGIEDGYAKASDYYFAVVHDNVKDYNGKKLDQTFVELILCFKHNWYFNGQSYRIHEDGTLCRNFQNFFPNYDKEYRDSFGTTLEDAAKLREQMLKAGMEEKPELIKLWYEACNAKRERNLNEDY